MAIRLPENRSESRDKLWLQHGWGIQPLQKISKYLQILTEKDEITALESGQLASIDSGFSGDFFNSKMVKFPFITQMMAEIQCIGC